MIEKVSTYSVHYNLLRSCRNMSSIGARYLLVSCQPHQCGVLFFIVVELDGAAVVAHFGKREANHFLLFLRDGASLLLHLVVDFRAEARHYFVSGTAQVSRPHARCRRCSICPTQSVPCGRTRRTGRADRPLSRQDSPPYRFHSHSLPASCRLCGAGICRLSRNVCLRCAQSQCLIGCILLRS